MYVFNHTIAFTTLLAVLHLALPSQAGADDAKICAHSSGDTAIAACTRLIKSGAPQPWVDYYNRGIEYKKKGDNDKAIADFTEAIRLNPKYTFAYFLRGGAYRAKGAIDRSIADFNEAIRLDPQYQQAYVSRGNSYWDKDEFDRAIADYSEAIRLNPKFALAYTNRGMAYERTGEIEKARRDFKMVLELPEPTGDRDKWEFDTARSRLAKLPSQAPAPVAGEPSAAAVGPQQSAPSAVTPGIGTITTTNDDRRVALVIGNSAYEKAPALLNPERDAKLVADVLRLTGFKSVTLLTNLRREAMISALRDFATLAETADWAMIYYAGHGMEVGGVNYLVPVDATIAADRDIGFETIPLDQVMNAAERANKLRLVVLDACRDNPFKARMKRTLTIASRSVSNGLAAVEPSAGTMVVYAAKDGQQASDGDGINSPFTTAFVKNVQTPGLEVRRLFDYVRDDVMESTKSQQQPFSYGSISGRRDFYFVAGK